MFSLSLGDIRNWTRHALECSRMFQNVLECSEKFHGWVVVWGNYRVISGPVLLNLRWEIEFEIGLDPSLTILIVQLRISSIILYVLTARLVAPPTMLVAPLDFTDVGELTNQIWPEELENVVDSVHIGNSITVTITKTFPKYKEADISFHNRLGK